MTYLDDLAAEIERHVAQDLLPNEDTRSLFRLYAVLALAKGRAVDSADVHNAWAAWMQERDPHHRSIKPFHELDTGTRAADEPFLDAIRAVTERLDRARLAATQGGGPGRVDQPVVGLVRAAVLDEGEKVGQPEVAEGEVDNLTGTKAGRQATADRSHVAPA